MMEAKRKALGRGFGALLPTAPPPLPPTERMVAIADIVPNRRQPRTGFDDERLGELAASIREHGVLQPLLVRPRAGGGFELIAGERRLRASKLAGLDAVPVRVQDRDDRETLELALIENLQRDDLAPLDEAAGYQSLLDDFGLTQEELARRVGKSRPAVANTLRLLQLPEPVRDELRSGRLSAGHARALLALGTAAAQIALAREAVRLGLSVRQLEERVRSGGREPAKPRAVKDLHAADVERQLMRSLGTRVRIVSKGGRKGRIVIEFYSPEELESLVARLR
jgi:ParB family transcriptional regulator, chromosome partitioning protein